MIKKGKVNPLNVFEVRRLSFCPSYFEGHNLTLRYNINDSIVSWIEDNLSGRYYIGKNVILDEQSNITNTIKVAFEKNHELTHFLLACPYLKYN